MQRRALLATIGTATTAGCGWSQYTNDGGRGQRGPAPTEENGGSDGGGNGNGDEADDVPTSEGGDTPIEADEASLLLTLEDLESDEWEAVDPQSPETCNGFERDGPEYSFELEACATVHDDGETATEEYEKTLDSSIKTLSEQLDRSPVVGDEAALFAEGERENRIGQRWLRLVFLDSNATGRIDFVQDTGLSGGENVPDVTVDDVVVWGVRMHRKWRS